MEKIQKFLNERGEAMRINEKMKKIISEEGRTQKWVLKEMNRIEPTINLTDATFSAAINGNRKVTGDELIAFCRVMGKNPEVFMEN